LENRVTYQIEHKSYWVVKRCNLDLQEAGNHRKLQLQELDGIRLEAYENSSIYKEKVRKYNDLIISRKEFSSGEKVLLYNSRLKLIAGKLTSKWDAPFTVIQVFPNGAVEIKGPNSEKSFKVNGHRPKHFQEGIQEEKMIKN